MTRPNKEEETMALVDDADALVGPVRTAARVLRRTVDHAVCSVAARDAGHDDALLAIATVGLTRAAG